MGTYFSQYGDLYGAGIKLKLGDTKHNIIDKYSLTVINKHFILHRTVEVLSVVS